MEVKDNSKEDGYSPKGKEGIWMNVQQISEKFGYTQATFYNKLKDHGGKVQIKKEGKANLYLINDENRHIFEKKKKGKQVNEPLSKSDGNGDETTWDEMRRLVQNRFGKRSDDVLISLMKDHGKELQVGQDRFSSKKLQELMESYKSKA